MTATVAAAAPRLPTPFGAILRRAVDATPGAVGGAFAASDGELVDSYTVWAHDDWAILTAHYGVVLGLMHSAFGTWHFGSPDWFVAEHGRLDVVVAAVDSGYYALLALGEPRAIGPALEALEVASVELRREMA
jgi:hypothetical protein